MRPVTAASSALRAAASHLSEASHVLHCPPGYYVLAPQLNPVQKLPVPTAPHRTCALAVSAACRAATTSSIVASNRRANCARLAMKRHSTQPAQPVSQPNSVGDATRPPARDNRASTVKTSSL